MSPMIATQHPDMMVGIRMIITGSMLPIFKKIRPAAAQSGLRKMLKSRTAKQWGLVVVPAGLIAGFMLKAYHESKVEEELYEEAMFQKLIEERQSRQPAGSSNVQQGKTK